VPPASSFAAIRLVPSAIRLTSRSPSPLHNCDRGMLKPSSRQVAASPIGRVRDIAQLAPPPPAVNEPSRACTPPKWGRMARPSAQAR
jgi:hypothetical protein